MLITIELFRILFTVLVIFQHFAIYDDSMISSFLSGGGYAVTFFFILSGVLFAKSCDRYDFTSFRNYAFSIFKRKKTYIYNYELLILISFLYEISIFTIRTIEYNESFDLSIIVLLVVQWMLSALGIAELFPSLYTPIFNAGWYLAILIWCYLLYFPFKNLLCFGKNRIYFLFSVLVCFVLLLNNSWLIYYGLITRFFCFIFGMELFGYMNKTKAEHNTCFAKAIMIFFCTIIIFWVTDIKNVKSLELIVSLISSTLIIWYSINSFGICSPKNQIMITKNRSITLGTCTQSLILFFGKNSFYFYLYHFILLKILYTSLGFLDSFFILFLDLSIILAVIVARLSLDRICKPY